MVVVEADHVATPYANMTGVFTSAHDQHIMIPLHSQLNSNNSTTFNMANRQWLQSKSEANAFLKSENYYPRRFEEREQRFRSSETEEEVESERGRERGKYKEQL
jgi:hypothetical protein